MNILMIPPKYSFLKLNKEPDYSYAFPLGLAYISSVIKKNNYNVDVLNLNHYYGLPEEIINKRLNLKRYDLVCTGGNALMYSALERVILAVKNHPSKPKIILGGLIVTCEPELIFRSLKPDFAVVGEGEYTIVELLKCIENNKDPENVKGIIYLKDKKIKITPARAQIDNLEVLPWPDFEGFEFEKHLDNIHFNDHFYNQVFDYSRTYPILGSRGCPFNCTFCWHPTKYRERSIKDVMKELRVNVKKYKINNISLYDDCFSANNERVYEFCREIKKLEKEVGWEIKWLCQLLVKSVDSDLLRTMKESGCDIISYGFESYSQEVLNSMGKPITPEQIDIAINKTLDAGIAVQGHFILGDPAETLETARTTINYWKYKCRGSQTGLGFIQPYPGSELYRYCLKKGLIQDRLRYIKYEMGPFNNVNMTRRISDKQYYNLKREVLNANAKYIKFAVPSSIRKTKKYIFEFDVLCPFCKKTVHYQNCFIKNRLNYGFYLTCRNCHMRFFLVSLLQKIAYRFYPLTRPIRDSLKSFQTIFMKKRFF